MNKNSNKIETGTATITGKAVYFLICATIIWTTLIYGTVHQPILGFFYIVTGVIALLWMVDSFRSGEIRIDGSLFQIPIAAAAAYALVQIIPYGYHSMVGGVEGVPKTISLDPFATQVAALHFVALLIFVAAALVFVDSKARLRAIVRLITVFGFVFAFYGILQMVLSPNKIYGIYETDFAAPFASFVNRHNFAAYMEMTIAVPLGLLLSGAVHKDKKLLYITALGVMGVALLLSGSRGGLVSAIAGIGFLMFVVYGRAGKRKLLIRLAATVIVVGVIIAGAVMIGGENSLTRIADTASSKDITTNRKEIWSVTTQVIREHYVLGAGMGAFGVAYSRHDPFNGLERAEQAHNDYLEVVADAGIIGAVLAICFVYFLFRSGFRTLKSHDPLVRGASAGAMAGCFAVLVHSLFDFVLHVTAVSVLFLTLAAIIGVCARLRHTGSKSRKPRPKRNVTPINQSASA